MRAFILASSMLGKEGILPFPCFTVSINCGTVSRAKTSTREGNAGGDRLRRRSGLAGHGAGREGTFMNGKQRLPCEPVEDVQIALLGGLRQGVYGFAVADEIEEHGRRWKVAVPDVVMHALEVPDALAGGGIEREQGVGVEVVAGAVATVVVEDRGAGRRVDDAVLGIESHAGPVVGRAGSLPGVWRPGFVAHFARMGNSVEG